MTADEVYQIFIHFIDNEFKHMMERIDSMGERLDKIYTWLIRFFIGFIMVLISCIVGVIVTALK